MADDLKILIQAELEKQLSTKNINTDILSLEKKLNNIKLNAELDTDDIKNINTQINTLLKNIKPIDIKLNIDGSKTSNFTSSFADQGIKAGQNFSTNFNKSTNLKINNSTLNTNITDIETNLKKLYNPSEELQNKIKQLSTNFKELDNIQDSDKKVQYYSKLKEEIFNTSKEVNSLIKAQGQQVSVFDKSKLDRTMQAWLNDNTKAADKFGDRIKELQSLLATVDNKSGLTNISKQFQSLQKEAKALGVTGRSTVDEFKNNISKFAGWFGISQIIMTGVNALKSTTKEMITNVKEINSAMISLKKVTNDTETAYNKFLDNSANKARSLGRAISSLVEQTAEWAKLGYSLNEASKLAEVSSIYANVGEVDDKTAVSDLVTGLKAMNMETSEAIRLVDIYNKLGNEFAVTSAGIGEGVKNSASALALQGNSIEQIVAMLAGGGEITQNVGELGNMLKVASLRIASMKGSLEELGETYDDISSVSSNQTKIYNLTKGQVNILDEQNNKLKDTYTILAEVADAWDDINKLDQSSLLELLFGKQRANQGAAILQAFQSGKVQEALDAANNSVGSALAEQHKYMEGIQYSSDRMKASFQELSSNTINSDWIKMFYDLSNILINVVDKVGLFNIALITTAGILNAKNGWIAIGWITKFTDGLSKATGASNALGLAFSTMIPVALIVGGIAFAIKKYNDFNVTLEEQKEKLEDANTAYKNSKSELESINSQLQTTALKMDELNSKDNLTFVEQGELDNLKKVTEELLIQQDILEKKKAYDAKQLADEAVRMFNKQFGKSNISQVQIDSYVSGANASGNNAILLSDENDISSMIAAYKQLNKLKQEAFAANDSESAQRYKEALEDVSNSLYGNVSDLTNWKSILESLPDDLKDNQAITDINNAIELIYQNLDPSKWKQIKFDTLISSNDTKQTIDKLKEIAKAGELTPQVLTSTEEYSYLLESTGLTAIEVAEQINAMTVSTEESTEQTKRSAESLYSLADAAKEATGYVNDLGEDVDISKIQEAVDTALSAVKDFNSILKSIDNNKGLTSNDLDTITQKYPQLLSYIGDEKELRKQLTQGIKEQKEVAKGYYKDILELDTNLYNNIISNNSTKVNKLSEYYETDLSNYKSLAKAKNEVETTLLTSLNEKWADYYSAQAAASEIANHAQSSFLNSGVWGAAGGKDLNDAAVRLSEEQVKIKKDKARDEQVMYNQIKNLFVDTDYTGLNVDAILLSNDKSNKSKKDAKNKFSNQIDWTKESINKLETEMKRYQALLDNTSSISKQIKYTKKLISTQSQLKTAYSKSSDTYSKEYNNALSKLSPEDQKKVKNGTYSIESFNDKNVKSGETGANEKRYNNIQDAIKLRDAFNDSTIASLQANAQLVEYAKTLATIRWDKASEKCDKFAKDIDLLESKMVNSVGYKAENKYLDSILDKYKKMHSEKKKAVKDTNKDINNTKSSINKKYKTNDRVNSNGTLKTTGVTISSQLGYITEYNALILQQIENNKELKLSEQELKSIIADNATAKFDNIANYYDQRTGIVDKKKERLDKELDILEAKGLSAGKAYYNELIRLEGANVDYLNNELTKLQAQLDGAVQSGDVAKYSPKWYDMVNAIFDVKGAIQDCTLNTIEFKKAIDQIGFDNLDRLINRLSSLQKESDFLIDLMSNTNLIGKDGSYTDTGIATQGQHAQNYNNYMFQSDEYAKQIKAWDSKYGKLDVGDENYEYYIEKRGELIASQQELIKSAESEKKAMIELAKEGIHVQIDAYKEAINKQKELLDAEKDLADFQKSLIKKRQSAALIQKRLNAISGDDSDEKRKLRKQLEKELTEAKDDLESFEKDKYVQNQKKDLDESVTQYEKDMKDYMKNTDLIFTNTLNAINSNSTSIANTIKNTASNVGYSISSQITTAWTSAGSSVTAYSSKFQTASVGMLSTLSQIKDAYDQAALSAETMAKSSVKAVKSDNSDITSAEIKTPNISKSTRTNIEKILNNGKGRGDGTSDLNKYITDTLGKKNQISYEQAVELAKLLGISGVSKKEDMIGNTAKKNEILEALKKAGFKKGGIVGEINNVIGENGDHGIATVRTDEVILDPKESKVLKDFVKLSPDFLNTMSPVTKYGLNDPIRKEDNTMQQGINVTITAPLVNVENMDENMLYKMKNDKKIQQTMQDIVLGQSINGIKNTSSGRNLRR
jgi:TP901 family phage tail tape measure protein